MLTSMFKWSGPSRNDTRRAGKIQDPNNRQDTRRFPQNLQPKIATFNKKMKGSFIREFMDLFMYPHISWFLQYSHIVNARQSYDSQMSIHGEIISCPDEI
jgi:hypothetical protein